MRYAFPPSILLCLAGVVAACGGGGEPSDEPPAAGPPATTAPSAPAADAATAPSAPAGDAPAAPSATPGAAEPTPPSDKPVPGALGALGEARALQVKTALLNLNKALLQFYILEDRYPADQAEFDSHPKVAAAVQDVKAVTESVRYTPKGDSYEVQVKLRDGTPVTLTGSTPGPRGGVP